MADEKKLSVAEILAAARKLDGGKPADEDESAAPSETPTEAVESEAASSAAAEPPAPQAAEKPKLKSGERPSVADMLAMARGETKAPTKAPAAKKPAAKEAGGTAAKPAAKAKPGAKAKPAERMDTASILAAARSGAKRGPVSKAEAPELAARKPAKPAKAKPAPPEMPAKPAYALPSSQPEADQGRRFVLFGVLFGSFFAAGMTLLAATFTVWTLALARFMFPNILTEPPSKFTVGFPDNFAPGQVTTKFKAQFGVWVVNAEYKGEPLIFALSTVCTHLGCTPNWLEAEQKFKCPCHGSGFYKDGINFEGPAPRPLERYAIRVADDGQVEIDKSRKFQEEMGQWEDPASFVPV